MMSALASPTMLIAAMALFGIGGVGAVLLRKSDRLANYWSSALALFGSVAALVFAVSMLASGQTFVAQITSDSFPLLSFALNIDRLAAFFLVTISIVTFFCSLYGIGYIKQYYGRYNIGYLGFLYNLFIVAMLLVVTSSNGIFFLIVWEIMSLASYFLVAYDRHDPENVKAGFLYLVMTHIGTAFILLAFILLYVHTGSFDFTVIQAAMPTVPAHIKDSVFLLALIGFGVKAGIIPLHIWLPAAHPAAPSHVSAIMSGVMIKTGIYMMIRLFLDVLQPAPLWWGIVVLVIAVASCVLGVLYALTEHDIKRLLAYHSIENIGIILLGVGSALVFSALGISGLAVLALTAALFHTLNHAIFKSLLFLSAGSVIHATGTRNMEKYGGLIKLMPATGLFFLVGSIAISALPPLNGFFSEWLTFQALFQGIAQTDFYIKWLFIGVTAALALTSGLAVACFVKAFGVTFLARPRSQRAEKAHEASAVMIAGMAGLAVLCVAVGVGSSWIIAQLQTIAQGVLSAGDHATLVTVTSGHILSIAEGFATVSAPLLSLLLIAVPLVVWTITRFGINRSQRVTTGRTWDGGTDLTSRMEITSTGFARSIILIFRGLLKPSLQHSVEYEDAASRLIPRSRSVTLSVQDVYRRYLYRPVFIGFIHLSHWIKNGIQNGNINAYILYILVVLLVMLGLVGVW
ncbi:hydrogenase 4 subunit B [Cryobacterium sp. M91]|uniref:hydrogenase 4 subunit B n=1 Tax=Cryobacterium sp. M91 TaxID=2048294 RepID=UPI000CE4AB9A|nr:hydrogenase 4 subunit B [Cryobacterium sp. M91]